MSCYDTIHFTCPECNKDFEGQSKAGKCALRDYRPDSVPILIGAFLNGERVFCPHCATEFVIQTAMPRRVHLQLSRVDDDD